MSTQKNLEDAQRQSYRNIDNNNTYQSVGTGSLLDGVDFDAVSVAYPSTTTEVYTYYQGGLVGTLVATVTLTYTNSSKSELSSAVRT